MQTRKLVKSYLRRVTFWESVSSYELFVWNAFMKHFIKRTLAFAPSSYFETLVVKDIQSIYLSIYHANHTQADPLLLPHTISQGRSLLNTTVTLTF